MKGPIMPLAYRQKPGWDYEPVTDDRDASQDSACDNCAERKPDVKDRGWYFGQWCDECWDS